MTKEIQNTDGVPSRWVAHCDDCQKIVRFQLDDGGSIVAEHTCAVGRGNLHFVPAPWDRGLFRSGV